MKILNSCKSASAKCAVKGILLMGLLLLRPWNCSSGEMNCTIEDKSRARALPLKIYYPDEKGKACPVIVFSHGLGGTCEGYSYLGRHWSQNGYISVHVQHPGSDDSAWRGQTDPYQSMKKASMSLANMIARPIDIKFAIDSVLAMNGNPDSPLFKLCDPERIGVAGHSFGAYTALASAGRTFPIQREDGFNFKDSRIKACIAMSPPAKMKDAENGSYAKFAIPCMVMTGTLDDSPIGDTKAGDRRIPFDAMPPGDKYLLTFIEGDHMIFSGRKRLSMKNTQEKDRQFQDLISLSSLKFWDAYLKDDAASLQWLKGRAFEDGMKSYASLERK